MIKYLSFYDLTNKQLNFFEKNIYNGVGSEVLGVKGKEYRFKQCALKHDFESFSGGTNKDRINSDKQFLKCCLNIVSETKKYYYYPIILFYYIMLLIFSRWAWDYYPEKPKNWYEFLCRVHLSIHKDKTVLSKALSKRYLKRQIKNKDKFKLLIEEAKLLK